MSRSLLSWFPRLVPACALALLAATPTRLTSQPARPRTGAEVLERMRAAYAGKWYHTLTFVQKTTRRRANGTDTVETWYESLQHTPQSGTRLRIDFGDPAAGNGTLYTADSSYRVRGGVAAAPSGDGNVFLPLIEGVYVQPVERTVKELASNKIDMSRVTTGKWQDRDVYIVGAASASDTTSPQFWIDVVRNVAVRAILAFAPTGPPFDIRLGGYVPLGGGWLATKIDMLRNGAPVQTEEYSDWKAGVALDPALFEMSTWAKAKHWAKPGGGD